jgi:DNA-binding HxlR family transcriptional regulator
MSKFEEHLREDRRLAILRILEDANGSANESVIEMSLTYIGHRNVTREMLRQDLRFLIDHGLVTDEWYGPVWVMTLTRRGVDVAKGREVVSGIKKPSIGI